MAQGGLVSNDLLPIGPRPETLDLTTVIFWHDGLDVRHCCSASVLLGFASTLRPSTGSWWERAGKCRGKIRNGKVYDETGRCVSTIPRRVRDDDCPPHHRGTGQARRADGETEIHLLTNLPWRTPVRNKWLASTPSGWNRLKEHFKI